MKGLKTIIIVLIVVILAAVAFIAGNMTNFKFGFGDEKTVRSEYKISESFESIDIQSGAEDILFIKTNESGTRIETNDFQSVKHTAKVENKTLKILVSDEKSNHISLKAGQPLTMKVYLPKTNFASLKIKGSSGDVEIPEGMNFESVEINESSGNIKLSSLFCKENIKLSVSSGDIVLNNINCAFLSADCSSGDMTFDNIKCSKLESLGNSGNLSMDDVVATHTFNIERSSGNIRLDECDAEKISIKASSGNVLGSLKSGKTFITETSSGSVHIPDNIPGQECRIVTSSGDINISIDD
ncbi:MAG: DUF4097 family beta strand repeat protein [Eubacterium sp.]|nr:DUF4097 family beta strand repeat protein [Eubacterium sp.]